MRWGDAGRKFRKIWTRLTETILFLSILKLFNVLSLLSFVPVDICILLLKHLLLPLRHFVKHQLEARCIYHSTLVDIAI